MNESMAKPKDETQGEFAENIGSSEARKMKARRNKSKGFGLVWE